MANLHRIFIAVNLSEKIRRDLCSFEDKCLDLPARWTKPENLHITLVFLGNATDGEVMDICKTAGEVAKRHDPFDVTIDKICYGPVGKEMPRMVWAVGEKSEELGALQTDLQNAFFETGSSCAKASEDKQQFSSPSVALAKGGFAPHVTLARIKQNELRQIEQDELPLIDEQIHHTFLVESIEVMESELKRGGPTYTVLESLRLGEL
jgi:2'-5' RNA ligase